MSKTRKSKIFALTALTVTALSVAAYPTVKKKLYGGAEFSEQHVLQNNTLLIPVVGQGTEQLAEKTRIDVVFALDTTGSMGGLIQAAKENIWSIASSMAQAEGAPEIRIGLVAYRDRGDKYVTKVVDLSSDLDSVYAQLMDFEADGGGDNPESVNRALSDAINKVSWTQDAGAYKVVFLVGDAPPHMDYSNEMKYPEIIKLAKSRNIVVNAIQCGDDSAARNRWQHIAQLGSGDFFQVEQSGGAIAMNTPFDNKMARLSKELDATRLYYGSAELKRQKRNKIRASEKLYASSSSASQAKRAVYNTSKSGEMNLFGDAELVEDISSGKVKLSSIAATDLPENMQVMSADKQKEVIQRSQEKRSVLKQQIGELSAKRAAYLRRKVELAGGAKDSLDEKIFSSIKKQARQRGIVYLKDDAAL